jgi:hypothetical protein
MNLTLASSSPLKLSNIQILAYFRIDEVAYGKIATQEEGPGSQEKHESQAKTGL